MRRLMVWGHEWAPYVCGGCLATFFVAFDGPKPLCCPICKHETFAYIGEHTRSLTPDEQAAVDP